MEIDDEIPIVVEAMDGSKSRSSYTDTLLMSQFFISRQEITEDLIMQELIPHITAAVGKMTVMMTSCVAMLRQVALFANNEHVIRKCLLGYAQHASPIIDAMLEGKTADEKEKLRIFAVDFYIFMCIIGRNASIWPADMAKKDPIAIPITAYETCASCLERRGKGRHRSGSKVDSSSPSGNGRKKKSVLSDIVGLLIGRNLTLPDGSIDIPQLQLVSSVELGIAQVLFASSVPESPTSDSNPSSPSRPVYPVLGNRRRQQNIYSGTLPSIFGFPTYDDVQGAFLAETFYTLLGDGQMIENGRFADVFGDFNFAGDCVPIDAN